MQVDYNLKQKEEKIVTEKHKTRMHVSAEILAIVPLVNRLSIRGRSSIRILRNYVKFL